MNKLVKKVMISSLSLGILFSATIPMITPVYVVEASENVIDRDHLSEDIKQNVGELISFYEKGYRADIIKSLETLSNISSEYGAIYSSIIDYWDWIEKDMVENLNVAPNDIPNADKHAFIVLGYALNEDGTMTDELIGRLEVAKASALKYPESYILVTGGVEKNGWTEGRRMRDWLIENGIDESRIIVEEKAPDTAGNAKNSFQMLYNNYDVESVSLITSQYHLKRGSILYYAESLLQAYELGVEPIKFIGEANAGWFREDKTSEDLSLKAYSLRLISRVSNIDISDLHTNLNGLIVEGKTQYVQGDSLEYTVKTDDDRNYDVDITKFTTVENYDPYKTGKQVVNIVYIQDNKKYTEPFEIEVFPKASASITKIELQKMVDENRTRDLSQYTRNSSAFFKLALQSADAVLTNEQSTQNDIIESYEKLNQAINRLVLLQNVAEGKAVTANVNQGIAYKVTDGIVNTSSYWESKDGNHNVAIEESYVQIDLNAVFAIDTIKVFPYWGTRYYQFDVLVSENGNDWITVAEERGEEFTTSEGYTYKLQEVMDVQYVKIQGHKVYVQGRPDINNFHLIEVQAFGEEIDHELRALLAQFDQKLEEAKSYQEQDYSELPWKKFAQVYQDAMEVRMMNPTKEEVRIAMDDLQHAIDHYLLSNAGHQVNHYFAKEATCTESGNVEYWYCEDCGRYFLDQQLTKETTFEQLQIPAKGHDIIFVPAKEPTTKDAGNIAYWYCAACDRYFKDEALTQQITKEETLLPQLTEDSKVPESETESGSPITNMKSPNTSDSTDYGLLLSLLGGSVLLWISMAKKLKHN